MHNRLSKVLAAAGVASRRACEELIQAGRVTVNREVVRLPQHFVTLGKDVISVDGKTVSKLPTYRYFAFNKPAGYLCTQAENASKRVLDFFDPKERLFTVGRLDKDTTGLIIVTNDGQFAQAVIHPSYAIEKEYLVKTRQEITEHHLKTLSQGTFIEGVHVAPVKVVKVRRGTLRITIQEGKKRQVRLMMADAGLEVLSLCRIRIGNLLLGTLAVGAWREISSKEREMLLTVASDNKVNL